MTAISVFQVNPATPAVAGWVDNLISPILISIRSTGRPIELRPTGNWGGWSADSLDRAPDGRFCMSNRSIFYSKTAFARLYLHELSHCLLDSVVDSDGAPERGLHGHDAAFFALNFALLKRLDISNYLASHRVSEWVSDMSMYDLQNPPTSWKNESEQVWKPKALAWAMPLGTELAAGDLTAEQIATEIASKYWAWSADLAAEPAKLARAAAVRKRAAAAANQKHAKDKISLILISSLAALGWLFLFIFWVVR